MKKITLSMLMLTAALFVVSCSDDDDNNSTPEKTKVTKIADYLGKQYVIELKIWRGNAYNERGEEQLCRYLEYFDLQEGYLLNFCFNKNKQSRAYFLPVHQFAASGLRNKADAG